MDTQIEIVTHLSEKLVDLLADPTQGGTVDLPADKRSQLRTEYADHIKLCINWLSNVAGITSTYESILDIAKEINFQPEN